MEVPSRSRVMSRNQTDGQGSYRYQLRTIPTKKGLFCVSEFETGQGFGGIRGFGLLQVRILVEAGICLLGS